MFWMGKGGLGKITGRGVRTQLDFLCEVKNKKLQGLCIIEIGNILLILWCIVLCFRIIQNLPSWVLYIFLIPLVIFISRFVFLKSYFLLVFFMKCTLNPPFLWVQLFFYVLGFHIRELGSIESGYIYFHLFFSFFFFIRIKASFFYHQRK